MHNNKVPTFILRHIYLKLFKIPNNQYKFGKNHNNLIKVLSNHPNDGQRRKCNALWVYVSGHGTTTRTPSTSVHSDARQLYAIHTRGCGKNSFVSKMDSRPDCQDQGSSVKRLKLDRCGSYAVVSGTGDALSTFSTSAGLQMDTPEGKFHKIC